MINIPRAREEGERGNDSEPLVIAGPKRGRPTPAFSIFIRSDRATEQASVVRLQRSNFVPYTFIKGQRDIGTTQEHRNKGTTQ